MHTRSRFFLLLILILVLFLSACAGTAPTVTIDQVQTVAAITFQAMTSQPVDTSLPPTLEQPLRRFNRSGDGYLRTRALSDPHPCKCSAQRQLHPLSRRIPVKPCAPGLRIRSAHRC